MHDPLERLYRTKLVLLATLLMVAGLALLFVQRLVQRAHGWFWLPSWPISDIGSGLFTTGLLGVALQYFDGQDSEERATKRLERVIANATPAMRDAVISGFAETPGQMRGVATTETLDKLATNALALRLGDQMFAQQIYSGLLTQAIRTPERWSDVDIDVRLSSIDENSTNGAVRPAVLAQLFDVVVTWEYTLIPSTRVQRFASTSDMDEFHDFLDDVPATSAWFIDPQSGADARETSAFEVLSYSVDGEEIPIRRSTRKNGQTYSVDLGELRLAKREPVRIRHVYRTVSRRVGHRFRIALTQPTHGMRLVLDYTDTDIAELKVGDMLSSAVEAQVKFLPPGAPAKQVEVSVPGWLLPKSEVSFVWVLSDEASAGTRRAGSRAA